MNFLNKKEVLQEAMSFWKKYFNQFLSSAALGENENSLDLCSSISFRRTFHWLKETVHCELVLFLDIFVSCRGFTFVLRNTLRTFSNFPAQTPTWSRVIHGEIATTGQLLSSVIQCKSDSDHFCYLIFLNCKILEKSKLLLCRWYFPLNERNWTLWAHTFSDHLYFKNTFATSPAAEVCQRTERKLKLLSDISDFVVKAC